MKSVVSYHAGIPKLNKSPEKSNILYYMIDGVNASGDTGRNHFDLNTLGKIDITGPAGTSIRGAPIKLNSD